MKTETLVLAIVCTFCICMSIMWTGQTISHQDTPQYYEYEKIINITQYDTFQETIGNGRYRSYQFYLDTGYSDVYVVVPGITNLYRYQPEKNDTCWIRYSNVKLNHMPVLIDLQLLKDIK